MRQCIRLKIEIIGMLGTALDKQIKKEVDMQLPLEWIEKQEGNLTPELEKELRIRMRQKVCKEVWEEVIANVEKKLAVDKQADDLAFFVTLKSRKLSDRLIKYRRKQKELAIDLHKKNQKEKNEE